MNEVLSYRKLGEVEHVLARSGIYLGSIVNTTGNAWIVAHAGDKVSKDGMVEEELTYNPGLLKLFDEIISNSVDAHIKYGKVTTIQVALHPMTGQIVVKDDGGIPVEMHPEYGTYVPEMIFGELRTGSNFNDDERQGAGMNGLGAKLTSIFSTEFIVDTCDGKKRFVQVFKDNLSQKGDPVIKTSNVNGTTITFTPDYARLACSLDDDNIAKITRRVYDIAGCNPKIKVFLNGTEIKSKGFESYVGMYVEGAVGEVVPNWEVFVAPSKESAFKQVSFVNGIDVFGGGTHVEYVANQIVAKIREFIKKKHKVDVKPANIRQHMFLFLNCKINAPMFNSQTKENLISDVRNFGSSYAPSDKFIKKVLESDVVQKVLDWVEGEKRRNEMAELRALNKTTQNTNFLKKILKFEDASSKDRMKCTLFLTEGDSACKTILGARDGEFHGAFPLKGKPLNVRDVEVKKLAANIEFQNIMSILGLKVGTKVTGVSDLRFGRVCILSDQDADGHHIRGLLINMINEFWPEVIELGILHIMNTPLVIAELKNKKFEFFHKNEYTTWAETNPGHKHKYFKGLGGFMTKDFKEFLQNPDRYMVRLTIEDATDIERLNMAFDKTKADQRKLWLAGEL